MSGKTVLNRSLQAALVAAATFHAGGAAALEFQIGENTLKVENLFTVGASWRMQDIDPTLIGKSTLHRMHNPITAAGTPAGLCYTRAADDGTSGADPALDNDAGNTGQDWGTYTAGVIASGCSFSVPASSLAYRDAPGSFAPNGDDGNLSFQKHDIVHAVAKLTSDISFSYADYNFFVRPIYYFDANYTDFDTSFPDTTLTEPHGRLPGDVVELVGSDLDVLDYNVSHIFTVMDHDISVKVGNQVVSWGESALLLFNSLNVVNAVDATKLRMPGLDLKELIQPQGMVVAGTDLYENISMEAWYQYEWKPIRVDPVGTFFSQSDTLGPGGNYAMLGFGKNPDDPLGIYEPIDTCTGPGATACVDSAGVLGATGTRTIYRDHALERQYAPDDTGQYGVKLQFFLENFNNGTELALYHANYHSRYPTASLIAADETCLQNAGSFGACGEVPGDGLPATTDPVPVHTAKLVVEYPEDIHLYGMSFNTTVGDFAIAGEYAFRDNLPLQIHTTDLTFAALNPAVPPSEINLGATVVPGRRQTFPDFVSVYRGITGGYDEHDYIRGYERLKSGQANVSILRLIGGDNPIGASQMTILLEMGMQQVFDMPGLHELQFQGGGVDTHISDGSVDGDKGINPDDPDPSLVGGQDAVVHARRQNPIPHQDLDGFGADESYGYRILNLNRWDSAVFGANLETLTIIQHDVKGTSPGIGTNFVQGRKQYAFGIRFDYLSTYIGEVRYSWNTGGARRDGLRDRDNIQVSFGIQF